MKNTRSLSLTACMMAKQHGINVVIGGSEAYTDGKTINLPSLPDDSDAINILIPGYLDHEAAHCTDTDFTIGRPPNGLPRMLYNAIEDCRIEKRQGQRYPGCKRHLNDLVTHLATMDEPPQFFRGMRDTDEASTVLLAYVLQKGRTNFVGQSGLAENYRQTQEVFERKFCSRFRASLDAIIDTIPDLQSTADSIQAANDIVELIKEDEPQPDDTADNQNSGGESGSGDEKQSAPDGQSASSDDNTGKQNPSATSNANDDTHQCDKNDTAGTTPDESKSASEPSSETDASQSESSAEQSEASDEPPQEIAQSTLAELKAALADPDFEEGDAENLGELIKKRLQELDTPVTQRISTAFQGSGNESSVDVENIVMPVNYAKARQNTAPIRHRLTTLLEAEKRVRCRRTASGVRLDRKKLATIRHPNTRPFLARKKRKQVNTAVQLLIDRSRSMNSCDRITTAGESAYALMSALSQVQGTQSACSAFPGIVGDPTFVMTPYNKTARQTQNRYVPVPSGSTPMAPALWQVGSELSLMKADRRVLMVLTDGLPNNLHNAQNALHHLRGRGIEIVGIGIQCIVTELFGTQNTIQVMTLDELAPKLFEVMRTKLLAA